MNSRQVLDKISRSRSLTEQQRLAQDAIAACSGSLREIFRTISQSTSWNTAAGLAHMTIDALDRDEAKGNRDSAPKTVDEIMEDMRRMRSDSAPAYDGWGEALLSADGQALMKKVRSNYTQRQRRAQRREDAIDKALADEPIESEYNLAKPSAQRMTGERYYF